MTDSDLPEPIREKLIRKRVAFDLVSHDRYDTYDEALADASNLIDLHLQGRDSLVSFEKKRLFRLEQRYSEVTNQSIGSGLELAADELEDNRHSIRLLAKFLL